MFHLQSYYLDMLQVVILLLNVEVKLFPLLLFHFRFLLIIILHSLRYCFLLRVLILLMILITTLPLDPLPLIDPAILLVILQYRFLIILLNQFLFHFLEYVLPQYYQFLLILTLDYFQSLLHFLFMFHFQIILPPDDILLLITLQNLFLLLNFLQ